MNLKLKILRWLNKNVMFSSLDEKIFTERLLKNKLEYYEEIK